MTKKINEILIRTYKISPEKVHEDLTMNDVDRWDSLTHMVMIVNIEEEFQIELEGDDIAEMLSFKAVREILKKYTN